MGGWMIVNHVGFLLFIKVDIFVINKYFGAGATGEYSAVLQWNVLIRTMASVLSNVIGPMLLISFANNKINDVIKFGKLGVKFLSVGIAIFTGILCGFSSQLLTVWLGPHFAQFSTLMTVMLCHLTINLGVLPLFPINTSLNKVKIPGLVTAGMGLLNLLLAIYFVGFLDFGFIGVAVAGAIILSIKNGLFTPWYSSKILNINLSTFYLPLVGGIFLFLLTYVISIYLGSLLDINNWFMIGVGSLIVLVPAIVLAWFIALSDFEKDTLLSIVVPKIKVLSKKWSGN
jgi:membrane protein EpsK